MDAKQTSLAAEGVAAVMDLPSVKTERDAITTLCGYFRHSDPALSDALWHLLAKIDERRGGVL